MPVMLKRALTAAPALLLVLGLAACGDSDDDTEARDDTSSSPTEESSEPSTTATETVTESGSGECEYVPDGTDAGVTPPPGSPSESGEVPVTLNTSVGELGLTLDATNAPCTVNSFVSLAEQGYFDGTTCHRMTTQGIFVLQCGDPTGTGTGGPGYSFGDELQGTETYGTGTLAMANAGPDTNGSQFFIVYGDSPLPPAYTVFGTADDDAVEAIEEVAADGTTPQGDGAPKTKVDIESVTVG
jgi:peptidyl-prolyl cis-trans isomerase B (cyclophilin B)